MKTLETMAQEIFTRFPTRFRRTEKEELFAYLREQLLAMGYSEKEITERRGTNGIDCRNLVVGKVDAPNVYTAHYDTPGRTGFLLGTSHIFGQTGANIFFTLAFMVIIFAAMAGVGFLTDYLEPVLKENTWMLTFAMPLVGIIAMLMLIVPMLVKNKNNRNDNTSGVLSLLGIAQRIVNDEQLRADTCLIFFDNEEWGLLGSGLHASQLKSAKVDVTKQRIINIDCVGVGDKLIIASTSRKNATADSLVKDLEDKEDVVRKTSSLIFMSDHACFKGAVMLSYSCRSKLGPLYLPRIHTSRDIECDLNKISNLCDLLVALQKEIYTRKVNENA